MNREEAERTYGRLITPTEASYIYGCTQGRISQMQAEGKLRKIEVEIPEERRKKRRTKTLCIESEVKMLKQSRKADTTD